MRVFFVICIYLNITEAIVVTSPLLFDFCNESVRILFNPVLKGFICICIKNLTEYLDSIFGAGVKDFQKLALCYHRNLNKLLAIDTEDFFNLRVDLSQFCHNGIVRQMQFSIRFFFCCTFTSLLRSNISRIPFDIVDFVVVLERQFYIGFRICLRIFTPQHIGFSVIAACFSIEGEGDCIEYRRFSRASITGDEI